MIGAIGVLSYEKVLMLHERGASVDVRNESNHVTALMAAATGENVDLVKLCIREKCDVKARDKVILQVEIGLKGEYRMDGQPCILQPRLEISKLESS